MASVDLRHVFKSFGSVEVIHGIDLAIADREFVVLVGPSGCGKSTLLRMIAGLEEISAGEVAIAGKVVNHLRAKARDIAMVFQNYALYPHMSVYRNMAFSLRLAGMPRDQIDERVTWAAKTLNLLDLLERRPRQLSGGQRQRVAMGRAIVRNPQVFLFDEPLSNLDAKLRVQMRSEIRDLHQRLDATSIYVTHDQLEAMTMADRIVVMNEGMVEQVGSPIELYDRPCNTFVAGFLGSPAMNFFKGVVRGSGAGLSVMTDSGLELPLPGKGSIGAGRPVIFGIRPEHLDFVTAGDGGFDARVVVQETTGAGCQIVADTVDGRMAAASNRRHAIRPGEVIGLRPQMGQAHIFDAASGKRL